jgi:hypothetical protein
MRSVWGWSPPDSPLYDVIAREDPSDLDGAKYIAMTVFIARTSLLTDWYDGGHDVMVAVPNEKMVSSSDKRVSCVYSWSRNASIMPVGIAVGDAASKVVERMKSAPWFVMVRDGASSQASGWWAWRGGVAVLIREFYVDGVMAFRRQPSRFRRPNGNRKAGNS